MSDDKELDYQAIHSYESEPLADELLAVLQKHCGEPVNGMTSVNADKAIPAVGMLLVHLLAPKPRMDRKRIFKTLAEGAATLNTKMHQRYGGEGHA